MNTNRHTVALYWEQIKKHKRSFFLAVITIPIAALFIDTLLPFFFSQAIGAFTNYNEANVWHNLLLGAIVGGIGALLNYVGFQSLIYHESNVREKLTNNTFERLIQKDMRFFVNEKVGALTSRFIDFIRSQLTLQDLLIVRTAGFVLSVGVGLVIVALQSWQVAIVITVLLIILVVQVKWSIKKRAPWRHERKELIGEIHGSIADAVTNNLIVKTFAGEQREINYISKKNRRFKALYIKDIGFVGREGSARVGVMVILQIAAISLSAYLVLRGHMQIATVIFSLTYLQRMASQLFSLGEMLNGYDQALLEAAPMSDILARKIVVTDRPNAVKLQNVHPTITFDDVSYQYSDSAKAVISHITLNIQAGEKVGLVGHSGAGKTTITHLLLRFGDVSEGSILIDGRDIRGVTQQSLRENIAYVPQEPLLFHRSLRENIAYGKPNATDEEIRQAAQYANALEFIDALPQGFDTLVGERGIKLSGGQRQRVAIARALLKDAPILLLDEATSALDSESEKLIQDALAHLMKDRTSIVVAHRLSTIQKMDRIVVLENGSIAEQGSHAELIKQKGIYAGLWAHQSGGFMEE